MPEFLTYPFRVRVLWFLWYNIALRYYKRQLGRHDILFQSGMCRDYSCSYAFVQFRIHRKQIHLRWSSNLDKIEFTNILVYFGFILDIRIPSLWALCVTIAWMACFLHKWSRSLLEPCFLPFIFRYSNTIISAWYSQVHSIIAFAVISEICLFVWFVNQLHHWCPVKPGRVSNKYALVYI